MPLSQMDSATSSSPSTSAVILSTASLRQLSPRSIVLRGTCETKLRLTAGSKAASAVESIEGLSEGLMSSEERSEGRRATEVGRIGELGLQISKRLRSRACRRKDNVTGFSAGIERSCFAVTDRAERQPSEQGVLPLLLDYCCPSGLFVSQQLKKRSWEPKTDRHLSLAASR